MTLSKLPSRFSERLRNILSPEDFISVSAAFSAGEKRFSAFRINTILSSAAEVEKELTERGIHFRRFSEIPGAYILPKLDEFSLKGSRAFYDGKIYVQSLASQLPAHLFDFSKAGRILDVCAAPGGKTTQLAGLSGNKAKIIALEQSRIRADKLTHNIKVQGALGVSVIRIPAENYLAQNSIGEFDAILLDAPCSSEGRIRFEDEKSYSFWGEDVIAKRAAIAWELFVLAWNRLKSGGEFVYSTCTLAPEENEAIISRALAKFRDMEIVPISIDLPFIRPGLTSFGKNSYDERLKLARRVLPSFETE